MIAFVEPYNRPRRRRRIDYLSDLPVGIPLPVSVLSIHDGDTISVFCIDKQITLRLRSIDAPELSQDYGPESTSTLEVLLDSGDIKASLHALDKYGRYIADLFLPSGQRIQDLLVAEGHVWVYTYYASHEYTLFDLQAQARSLHKGLWQQPSPVPPWVYRHSEDSPTLSPESLVFFSMSGYAFHRRTCTRLHYPIFNSTKQQALDVGRRSCAICNP